MLIWCCLCAPLASRVDGARGGAGAAGSGVSSVRAHSLSQHARRATQRGRTRGRGRGAAAPARTAGGAAPSFRPARRTRASPNGALPRAAAAARSTQPQQHHPYIHGSPQQKKARRRGLDRTLPQRRRLVFDGEGREDVRVHGHRRARRAQGQGRRRQRREERAGHGVANNLFGLLAAIHVDDRSIFWGSFLWYARGLLVAAFLWFCVESYF